MSDNEALNSSRVSELLQEPNFAFCCDKDQIQVNFQVYSADTAATTTTARWLADWQHKQRLRMVFAQIFSTQVADVRGSLDKCFESDFDCAVQISYRTKIKTKFKIGGFCEHEQRWRQVLSGCIGN